MTKDEWNRPAFTPLDELVGREELQSGGCLGVTSPEQERVWRFPNRQMSPVFTKDIRRVSSADNVVESGDASSNSFTGAVAWESIVVLV